MEFSAPNYDNISYCSHFRACVGGELLEVKKTSLVECSIFCCSRNHTHFNSIQEKDVVPQQESCCRDETVPLLQGMTVQK